jgi:molecular chaperone GrpE (heat shock protein)
MEFPIADPEIASETVGTAAAEPGASLAELSQEIRRVGRELFKTNRAAERNQELFEAALDELRQLATVVAQVPAQSAAAVFEAKASLCRELLEVADALEASLAAAQEVVARLRAQAAQPAQGIGFRFAPARRLRDALGESVEMMSQWCDGQQLLYQRLMSGLEAAGLQAIESAGRPFDPARHHAVSAERRPDLPAGVIVGEERKGYLLDGKVLRYAEVRVARGE